jgi:hypothetical protein
MMVAGRSVPIRFHIRCISVPYALHIGFTCRVVRKAIQRDNLAAVVSNKLSSGTVNSNKTMQAKGAILGIVCATALVGVAVWVTLEHQSALRLREENSNLRQQLGQMTSLAAENERLSRLLAETDRQRTLSDDQLRELLRLRGEVGVLREQSKELEILRNQNRQASSSLESNSKAQSAAPVGTVATADYWPRDSWAYAGYASPDASLQSSFWAADQGDMKTFQGGFTGEALRELEKHYEGVVESEALAKVKAEVAHFKSVRVLSREAQADDAVMLTVKIEDGSDTHTEKLLMQKVGNEWKLSGGH